MRDGGPTPSAHAFLAGGGEMGERLRTHDWSTSPLGPPEGWPQSLRTLVSLMLNSGQAMFVAWGPGLSFLYNDAYIPIFGVKHPRGLAEPFAEVWSDIWPQFGPIVERTLGGEALWFEDLPIRMQRYGYPEDTWFSFSYTPALDDDGEVAGLFCACVETTEKVLGERALRESEAQWRGLFNTMQEAFFVAEAVRDETGRVLDFRFQQVNPAFEAQTGLSRGRAEGRTIREAIPGIQDDLIETYAGVIDTGRAAEFELHVPSLADRWYLARARKAGPETMAVLFLEITDRKAAEAAVRESEEHYRHVVELNPQVTWTSAPDGQLDRVSQRWFEWTGTSGLGQTWGEAIHPDDLPPSVAAWSRSVTTGEPYDIEHRVRRRGGDYRWARSRAYPRLDAGGRIVKWYGTTEDIHERKLAEAALRESEERFRGITNSIDQMIWSTRPDGFHDFYNQRWYDYTGVPQGTTDGEGWNDVFHPEDQPRAWQVWRYSLETGEPYHIEYRLRHRSGVYRWVLGRAQPVRDDKGRIVRWFGTCTDIQEIVEAREVLAHSREVLEHEVEERTRERDRIWTLSHDLFATMGYDGFLKAVNPAWQRLLGYDEPTLLSSHFGTLVHPDDHAKIADLVTRLQRGDVVQGFEDRLLRADGEYVTVSWTASPGDGDVFYAVGRDVTAEREREEQLRQAQKMEAVGQLTGGVAHDFNNLLQIVVGNLELLERNLPADAGRLRRSTENAMQGARRAATLTQRLLAFSRRQPLDPKPIEVNRLVRGMSELLGRALGETIELETVLAGGLWSVEADPNQLESALLNLAVNARDAMPDGGKLTIESANTHLDHGYAQQNVEVAPGQYVVICVSDTGTGMSKDAAARAFEPFFTTKEPGKGTGLGLSQVYGFVKQSGGHVKIYSEVGEGTCVKLYLPRYTGGRAAEEEEGRGSVPEGSETVLVVEDDADVRSYTIEVLTELGYHVLEAQDGPSALRIIERGEPIDLLFTDVVLPGGLNGEQLALQAQDKRPGLKVLFTTGYARNAIVHQGRLDPGVQLITKPFSYTDLAARLRDVLDG